MKIKRSVKKTPSSHQGIADLIQNLSECEREEVADVVAPFVDHSRSATTTTEWPWPKTDLQHWINVLNRFDSFLEDVINDYDLSSMLHPQVNDFTPRTKQLLLAILKFTKLLLENATNRKLFASLDRLNALLHTTDTQVLLATLRLALRPAQLFSSAVVSHSWTFGISDKRLLDLAQSWGTREHGLDMADIASDDFRIPHGLDEVNWQYYKQSSADASTSNARRNDAMDEDDVAQTPSVQRTRPFFAGSTTSAPTTPAATTPGSSANAEGLTTIQLGNVRTSSSSAANILLDAIEVHAIPERDRLSLLQKIRIAKSLGSQQDRLDMLIVRLLSIAIFAHTSTESSIQSKLLLYEPEVVVQIAELVHPERSVSVDVQSAALYALEAFVRMKSKQSEVTSALNAGVSHGILMYIMRRTVSDLKKDDPAQVTVTSEFVDALFNFLNYLASQPHIGNMLIGAGIVAILVDFLSIKALDKALYVTKAVACLDALAYGYNSAFTLFLSANGHRVFVDRVEAEIKGAIETYASQQSDGEVTLGLLAHEQATLVKALLRGLQRMMQTFGTTEGLRTLIDSPLLGSCKTIMQNGPIFGHQILALAINIMATFVHNEPTCLTTVQETKAPLAFYDAIEENIPASLDVLQAIPNAIGALCLNQHGLDQFNARSSFIPKYFSVFLSDKHVRVLQERGHATVLGASIDELVRHHPSLKDKVYRQAEEVLQTLRQEAESCDVKDLKGYGLQSQQQTASASTEDVPMTSANATDRSTSDEGAEASFTDHPLLASIDVFLKFLDSFAQNPTHGRELAKKKVFDSAVSIYLSNAFPVASVAPAACETVASLLRTLCEHRGGAEMMGVIVSQLHVSVNETRDLYSQGVTKECVFTEWFNPTDEQLPQFDERLRRLSRLWKVVALLHDVINGSNWQHNKLGTSFLTALVRNLGENALDQFGAIYKFAAWQDSLVPMPTDIEERVAQIVANKPPEERPAADGDASTSTADVSIATSASKELVVPSDQEVIDLMKKRPPNVKLVHSILHSLCLHITSLFQALSDVMVHRRLSDATHRNAAVKLSNIMGGFFNHILELPEDVEASKLTAYYSLSVGPTVSSIVAGSASSITPGSTSIKTLAAIGFVKKGGFAQLLKVYRLFVAQVESRRLRIDSGELPASSKGWVPPVMAAILDLIRRLVSVKAWLDSPQSTVLLSRPKDATVDDYYQPDLCILQVRVSALEVLQESWQAPWFTYIGAEPVRKIAGMILTILAAEGEQPVEPARPVEIGIGGGGAGPAAGFLQTLLGGMGLAAGQIGAGGAAGGVARAGAFQVDETRVNQLVDMGFPRSAARTALTRARNNVDFATEYLLSHPDVVGAAQDAELAGQIEEPNAPAAQPDAAPAATEEAMPDAVNEDDDHQDDNENQDGEGDDSDGHDSDDSDQDEQDAEMRDAAEQSQPQTSTNAPSDPSRELAKRLKDQLDKARQEVKKTFLSTALSHAQEFPDLIFDVKGSFNKFLPDDKTSNMALLVLLQAIEDAPQAVPDDREKMVLTRLRLVALLAADPAYLDVIKSSLEEITKLVMRCHKAYMARKPSSSDRPIWLAAAMLVAEIVLAMSETPKLVAIAEEDSSPSNAASSPLEGPDVAPLRRSYMELALDLLSKGVSDKETFASTIHILLVTTRDHGLAQAVTADEGHVKLYQSFKQENPATDPYRSLSTIALRHVVESPEMLRHVMEREIEQWFTSQPRSKTTDVHGFLRGTSSLAFRNVPVFIEAVRATCQITNPDALSHYYIALAKDSSKDDSDGKGAKDTSTVTNTEDTAADAAKQGKVAVQLPAPSSDSETVAHFLLTELCQHFKDAVVPAERISEDQAAERKIDLVKESESGTEGIPVDTPLHPFYYAALLLSSLGELAASYMPCKTVLISFSARRNAKEPAGSHLKTRASFLYFLLNEMMPLDSIGAPSTFDTKKRNILASKAMDVVVGLCHDPERKNSAEIAIVRRTVLDTIAKAMKDATTSTESTSSRYGRLLSLSELCHRLLTSGPFQTLPKQDDQLMQIAKLMLEKNFAVLLTNALAEVDLNFPNVSHLINAILRPLEQLSKIVTKVGRAKGAESNVETEASRLEGEAFFDDDASGLDEDEVDTEEEMMQDDIDDEDEEGPDIYRNSALGMYEGELEPAGEDQYMTDGSAEDYDEEEEMMDELDDGVLDGTDVSDISEDEDNEQFDEDDEMMSGESDTDTGSGFDDEDEAAEHFAHEAPSDNETDDELVLGEDGPIEEVIIDAVEGDPEGEEWVDEDEEEAQFAEEDGADGIERRLNELAEGLRAENDPDTDDGEHDSEEEMYLTGELEFDEGFDEPAEGGEGRGANRSIWDVLDAQVDEGGARSFRTGGGALGFADFPPLSASRGFTAGRASGNVTSEAAAHPLLVDRPVTESRPESSRARRSRRGGASELIRSIEDLIGAGAVEAVQDLLGSHGLPNAGVDSVRLQIAPDPQTGGLAVVVDPSTLRQAGRHASTSNGDNRSSSRNKESSPQAIRNKLFGRLDAANSFGLLSTAQRCHEEVKLVQTGFLTSDRTVRLVNHVVNALLPSAKVKAREAKVKADQEKLEREEKERLQREAKAAETKESSTTESQHDDTMEGIAPQDDVAEVLNLARSLAAGLAVPSSASPASEPSASRSEDSATSVAASQPATSSSSAPDQPNTSASASAPTASSSSTAAGAEAPQQPRARVTIQVHGNEVDITDTGIDPEFLEALPDDMREEVINQHFREAQATRPPPTASAAPQGLSNEFLDALPPMVRAEVLRNDGGDAAQPGGPVDMDAASFLATLDPGLRQAVLLEQDDDFIEGLPGAIFAEASALRERLGVPRQREAPQPRVRRTHQDATPSSAPEKKASQKEVIQLLDQAGLATLVRLLFFPQPLRRHSLQKVLTNLCENTKTRADLIHMLLAILQHGTQDVSAVDKSFNQMSIRASKALSSHKDTPKRKPTDTPGGPLPHFPSENVPNLIAQRCVEALSFLVQSNSRTPLFFLTEQDMSLVLNRTASKKGKGKEKAQQSITYPIVALLGLLERESMLKTQSMMDAFTSLLAIITKPLEIISKRRAEEAKRKAQAPAQPAPASTEQTEATADDVPARPATEKTESVKPAESAPASKDDVLWEHPPQLPSDVVRLVVNILDSGECSSRTFNQTLSVIRNLSNMEDVGSSIVEELRSRAQSLARKLEPELADLQKAIETRSGVSGATLAKFSPASSLQARLLRVLKTIDWIHSPAKKSYERFGFDDRKLTAQEQKMREIYDGFDFAGLWTSVGDCLTGIENQPDLLYIATVLLPLIESLMVVSTFVGLSKTVTEAVPITPSVEIKSPKMLTRELSPDPQGSRFLKFTDEHRKVLNTMVRNNPSLMSGSFAVLVHNPKILEFDNKRSYFFSRLHDRSLKRGHYGTLQVNVRRQHVFEDSFRILQRRSGDEIKYGKLNVKFYEEEGVDAGGVTREWFSVLARQMFNPGYALFQPQAADAQIYQPNKASSINPDHLSFFQFVGRIIGKAIYDQRILEAYFSRAVYKHMLGKPVSHRDLESIDPEYHKSLVWMLENDIEGVLDLTFSVERDDFGVVEIVDLIPNGRNIAVTNENKVEYVRLIADQKLSTEIKDQIQAMLKGLHEVVPKDLLRIFTERELELLISGLPEIDVDEWRANTVLQNFSSSDPVIGFFWRAVRSFSQEERAKLLQFVTGSSRVPLEGFGSLQGMQGVTKFTIVNAGNKKGLPTAHTCFNSLELGTSWESYDEFRQTLLYAINEGATGFGFA